MGNQISVKKQGMGRKRQQKGSIEEGKEKQEEKGGEWNTFNSSNNINSFILSNAFYSEWTYSTVKDVGVEI